MKIVSFKNRKSKTTGQCQPNNSTKKPFWQLGKLVSLFGKGELFFLRCYLASTTPLFLAFAVNKPTIRQKCSNSGGQNCIKIFVHQIDKGTTCQVLSCWSREGGFKLANSTYFKVPLLVTVIQIISIKCVKIWLYKTTCKKISWSFPFPNPLTRQPWIKLAIWSLYINIRQGL